MNYMLNTLTNKREVDSIIRDTIDKVLVLRLGLTSDPVCLQLDDILCKSAREVSKFASVALNRRSYQMGWNISTKEDFVDVVEAKFRGAMKGKLIVNCPLPPEQVTKYQLLHRDV